MAAGGRVLLVSLLLLLSGPGLARGWDQPGRVLLREIQALTFYRDQYTTSRRTSPIPQLQCTGGTAGCVYVPMVVQCHNKGWDGFDIQWECKADLENSYRFGRIEVSCEGYDYPDDLYILRGSCGLQYGLELTEEGQRQANNFGGSFGSSYYQSSKVNSQDSSNSVAGVIVVMVLLLLAYGCYKLFLSNQLPQQDFSNGDGHARTSWQNTQTPPPPGFKSSFTGHNRIPHTFLMPIHTLVLPLLLQAEIQVALRGLIPQGQELLLVLEAQKGDDVLSFLAWLQLNTLFLPAF
uniref:Store-operated calcium entry-associated regulatory factor n=1 Tax=Chelonoidis abingdonii TaxID=106734 RepID=A0A8C0QPM7_CHEAB